MARRMTITAAYRKDADTIFAEALSLDQLHHDLRGLVDYHGMGRGNVKAGDVNRYTPVLWTFLQLPEVEATCLSVDPVARRAESRVVEWPDDPDRARVSHYVTEVTPKGAGCVWTDTITAEGEAIGWLGRRIAAHVQRAGHRRRAAGNIRIRFDS